jgi:hypothetical protein
MPHAVIVGAGNPESFWASFVPIELVEKGSRFKVETGLLSSDRKELLLRALVVERGFRKNFYLRAFTREEGAIHLGVDTISPPDKSEGVRRLIGYITWLLLQRHPGAAIQTTNIASFIAAPQHD